MVVNRGISTWKSTGKPFQPGESGVGFETFWDYRGTSNLLPLYLPYKPYEYDVVWVPGGGVVGRDGIRRFRRGYYKYIRKDNFDFAPRRNERFVRMSEQARSLNWQRSPWVWTPQMTAQQYRRTKSGEKVAGFLDKAWVKFKERRYADALERVMGENRRRSNVEVIDLTGDVPRVYKRHRPLNR